MSAPSRMCLLPQQNLSSNGSEAGYIPLELPTSPVTPQVFCSQHRKSCSVTTKAAQGPQLPELLATQPSTCSTRLFCFFFFVPDVLKGPEMGLQPGHASWVHDGAVPYHLQPRLHREAVRRGSHVPAAEAEPDRGSSCFHKAVPKSSLGSKPQTPSSVACACKSLIAPARPTHPAGEFRQTNARP